MELNDVADLPIYSPSEAARIARTSPQTIARWRQGYTFPVRRGRGRSKPVTGGSPTGALSFNELLEVAVVAAARQANIPMQGIRRAVDAAKDIYKVDRPLLALQFKHNGRDLFTQEIEADQATQRYINLSRWGQVAWDYIADVLSDLDYDRSGRAIRWFPGGRTEPIVIDPHVSFGRPYVVRKGISTDAVRSRFLAREPLESIAEDLGLTTSEAEAALRFELPAAA